MVDVDGNMAIIQWHDKRTVSHCTVTHLFVLNGGHEMHLVAVKRWRSLKQLLSTTSSWVGVDRGDQLWVSTPYSKVVEAGFFLPVRCRNS